MTIMMGATGVAAIIAFPRAQNFSVIAFMSNGANSVAAFDVRRNGSVNRFSPNQTDLGDYVSSGLPDATIGDLYEIRVIQSSGDTLTDDAGLNVFLQISSNLRWGFDDTPGAFKAFVGTWEVREIANPSNTSGTASLVLNTEDGS